MICDLRALGIYQGGHILLLRLIAVNMKNVCCVLAVAWIVLVANSVFATDYHIKSQADFDKWKRHTFAAGDNIVFHRGKRFKGMFAPIGNGAKGAPIRISTAGDGGKPRIDAGGEKTSGIFLQNPSFWEISGLEITNTNGSSEDQGELFGIRVVANQNEGVFEHVYISNCYVHDVNGKVAGKHRGGIHVQLRELEKSIFHDLRITNNRIEDVGGVGIGNSSSAAKVIFSEDSYKTAYLWTDVYVADNYVNRTGRNCIIARSSKDAIYERNTLANSSRYDTGHSIFCFGTDGIKIQYNEAYGNVGDGGMDRGGFDADFECVNTFIQYNYSHDNLWFCGIMKRPNRHVVIRYNLSVNDREGIYFYGFDTESDARDVHIYNNTHFVGKQYQASVFPEGRTPVNSNFENNIFYFEGEGEWGKVKSGQGVTFRNNLYYGITPHPNDTAPLTKDPKFRSAGKAPQDIDLAHMKELLGYQLRENSAAVKAGRKIKSGGGLTLEKEKASYQTPNLGALGSRSGDPK